MDDAALMSARQARRDLGREVDRHRRLQGTAKQPARQRLALAERGGHEEGAVVGVAGLIDGTEIGMIEACQGRRLAAQAPAVLPRAEAALRDDAQRHEAVELQVPGLVDRAEDTLAEPFEDLVSGNGVTAQRTRLLDWPVGNCGPSGKVWQKSRRAAV